MADDRDDDRAVREALHASARSASVPEALADEFTVRAVDVSRFEAGVRRDVLKILRDLEDELAADVARVDPTGPARTAYQQARLEALQRQTADTIATAYKDARGTTTSALRTVAVTEARAVRAIVARAVGVDIMTVAVSPNVLRALATDVLVSVSPRERYPLSEWWATQEAATRRHFMGEMRSGILRGETNDELVARVRGAVMRDADGKVLRNAAGEIMRAPGVLEASRRDATTLVRTATNGVSNTARMATFEENDDVVRGVAASTTFDLRISDICIARTGAAWDLAGKPLPESTRDEPFPGPPPWHPNCRTSLISVLKSLREILGASRPRKRGELRDLSVAKRASMDGHIPASTTFEQFLKRRSADEQKQILGAGKYGLWKSGELSLSELIDQTGRPIGVRELEARASA